LLLSTRRDVTTGADQWIAAPTLRMALRWPRRHQFELELGARLSSQDFPEFGSTTMQQRAESTEYFANAGYWWEF
jgi:hypothetical protein